MMPNHHAAKSSYLMWTSLIFLAGIDGFKLLEPLRELGARPFFLVYGLVVALKLLRGDLRVDLVGLLSLGLIMLFSGVGYLLDGRALEPFGDKTIGTQFIAHSILFMIGMSPIWLHFKKPIEERLLLKSATAALILHLFFIIVDACALVFENARPFENSFLGSVDRAVPTGVFSEPSYSANYIAILLPVLLYRAKIIMIFFISAGFSLFFFLADVRTFFVVYSAGLFGLFLVRWGVSWKTLLAFCIALSYVAFATLALGLVAVDESLSSAYRIGNTIAYLKFAFSESLFIGSGFGSSHFLYPQLSFPSFMYNSLEFFDMLQGVGYRVPVFNLWARMFVEVGIIPTLGLLLWLAMRFHKAQSGAIVKVYFIPVFVCSLAVDSYIYGMFTIGLIFLFSNRSIIDFSKLTSRHQ